MRQFDYSYLADRTWDNEIIPYMEQIDGFNMNVFAEEYRDVQVLRKMLDDFRKQ